jgi:hypothetical protein
MSADDDATVVLSGRRDERDEVIGLLVGGVREGRSMDLLIAGCFFFGTALRMATSLRDFKASRRRHLEWWITEDQLMAEIPRWQWLRRLRARRTLREIRAPDVHVEIQHMTKVFVSWKLLWVGAVANPGSPTIARLGPRTEALLATEPPTRSLIVCTAVSGVKGALRRYAMASGHP